MSNTVATGDTASAPRAGALPTVEVRKLCTLIEESFHDGGMPVAVPHRKAAVVAVIRNPYAGRYVEVIEPFMEALKPLGLQMARRLVDALGGDPKRVEAYGKGTVVGIAGELEHGAFWHVPGGYAMREVLGGAKAIVPSTAKIGVAGTAIDIPVHHIDAAQFESTDVAFHYEIARIADNVLFTGLHEALTGWLMEQRTVSLRDPAGESHAAEFHTRIFDAIAVHNADAAEDLMRMHLLQVESMYWNAPSEPALRAAPMRPRNHE